MELGEDHIPHPVLVKLSDFPHPTLHQQAETSSKAGAKVLATDLTSPLP